MCVVYGVYEFTVMVLFTETLSANQRFVLENAFTKMVTHTLPQHDRSELQVVTK